MALSGNVNKKIGTSNAYTIGIDWVVNSQSVQNNTSNITLTLYCGRTDGYPSYGAYNLASNNTVSLTAGTERTKTTTAQLDFRTTKRNIATWTGDVYHTQDGTLSLYIAGYFFFNSTAASSLSKGQYVVSGTADISPISRSSSVAATDANVGSVSMISISGSSSSYTHTIAYSFGTLSGVIATKTTERTVAWTVPTSFYSEMPNERSKSCTITCTTYSGQTQIGSPTSCTMTASAVDTVNVSGSVTDTNQTTVSLTGDSSKIVLLASNVTAAITATTNNGASISSKTINGSDASGGSITIQRCNVGSFRFYANDSRGYESSQTITAQTVPYVALSSNPTVSRDSPTGSTATVTLSGNVFNGDFGAKNNAISAWYWVKEIGGEYGDAVSIPVSFGSGNTYSGSAKIPNLSYERDYVVWITVADKINSVPREIQVLRGIPIFDWGSEDFNFNVPVKQSGHKIGFSLNEVNGWVVRAYEDGTLEQWRDVDVSFNTWNQWNNGYWFYSSYVSISFGTPFISGSKPSVFCSNVSSIWAIPMADTVTNSSFKIYGIRPYGLSSTYRFSVFATGKWK